MARRSSITCSIAALLAVAGSAVAPTAHAQSTTATQVTPLPARKIEAQRRLPTALPPTDDDAPAPAETIVRTGEDGEVTVPGETTDGDDPARPQLRRNGDGEPTTGTERAAEQDGTLPVGEAQPAQRDGESDLDRDPRSKADIDALEKPAAGYDAVAFQIELIDPVLDRRPARLARFEPYDPLGIRRGTWIIFPELELGLGATSNIRRSPSDQSATIFDARATVRAITNWRVHAIELKATSFGSIIPGFASEADQAFAVEARGRYDFSKRSNVEMLVSHARDQETRQARDAVDAARQRSDILTTKAAVAFNQKFNRLSLQLRGSVTDTNYEPVTTNAGATITNGQRDLLQRETAVRATWEFKPTLLAFTEVSANDRGYRERPSDGISRDSKGLRAVAGVSFGSTGKTWRGEVSIGYGEQRPDDGRISTLSGLIFDANLALRLSALSSLLFTARTDLNDSTTVGQSGSIARTLGVEARHAFRRDLIGTATLRNTHTDYRGVSLNESETTGELGVEYFLNRSTTLFGRYTHTVFDSSAAAADYTVDAVRVGVRWRQ